MGANPFGKAVRQTRPTSAANQARTGGLCLLVWEAVRLACFAARMLDVQSPRPTGKPDSIRPKLHVGLEMLRLDFRQVQSILLYLDSRRKVSCVCKRQAVGDHSQRCERVGAVRSSCQCDMLPSAGARASCRQPSQPSKGWRRPVKRGCRLAFSRGARSDSARPQAENRPN